MHIRINEHTTYTAVPHTSVRRMHSSIYMHAYMVHIIVCAMCASVHHRRILVYARPGHATRAAKLTNYKISSELALQRKFLCEMSSLTVVYVYPVHMMKSDIVFSGMAIIVFNITDTITIITIVITIITTIIIFLTITLLLLSSSL